MDWFWLIIAAVLGGLGNGLAGISAATVLVPMLIVLCPAFTGNAGAFMATTLALICDIPSSAVTAREHMRHGNIDLKRGWIMLICVLSMSVAGSIAAWAVGGMILGGFSLVLTLGIGIRYLVRPVSNEQKAAPRGAKLDAKAVGVSLFFGLTIGFGTGFVGTGGGMMMFIVFTAFLGMRARRAVGTATFIMTGTAFIASVAHLIINQTLIVEHCSMVLVAVIVATVVSHISARFANQVAERTVGLVTGVVLTCLGASMIILRYRDLFAGLLAPAKLLIPQVLSCFGWCLVYIVCFAGTLFVMYIAVRVPRNVFRKLLHLAAFTLSVFVVLVAQSWIAASLALVLFAVVVYPALSLLERWHRYDDLFVQKHSGEVKQSLLLLFLSQAALVAIAWGALGGPYIAATASLTWGFGDMAAAWVGRPFGKHKVAWRLADPAKSWEGSSAMFAVSWVTCAASLIWLSPYPPLLCLLLAVPASAATSFAELVSRHGLDTVTCPATCLLVLWLLGLAV